MNLENISIYFFCFLKQAVAMLNFNIFKQTKC